MSPMARESEIVNGTMRTAAPALYAAKRVNISPISVATAPWRTTSRKIERLHPSEANPYTTP